jgi:hypothetical protein
VQYQVLMVVKVLEMALAKSVQLVRSVHPQLEGQAVLLHLQVEKVLRQALALEQVALRQAQEGVQEPLEGSQALVQAPLVELVAPPQLEAQAQEQVRLALVEAEAQVEVLAAE